MKTPIPNNLRMYRELKALRQVDVACALGFSSTDRISKWEEGLAYPHMLNLIKLSRLYGAEPEELYSELVEKLGKEVEI